MVLDYRERKTVSKNRPKSKPIGLLACAFLLVALISFALGVLVDRFLLPPGTCRWKRRRHLFGMRIRRRLPLPRPSPVKEIPLWCPLLPARRESLRLRSTRRCPREERPFWGAASTLGRMRRHRRVLRYPLRPRNRGRSPEAHAQSSRSKGRGSAAQRRAVTRSGCLGQEHRT